MSSPTTRRAPRLARPRLEALEVREVLAAAIAASLDRGVLTIQGTDAADRIVVRQANNLITIDNVRIGAAASVRAADVTRIVVFGNRGNDVIDLSSAGAKTAELRGGDGNDTIYGTSAADTLFGEAGDDFLDGWGGSDTIYGGTGADAINDVSGVTTYNAGESDGRLTVYINFDGASLTAQDLRNYAGRDWSAAGIDANSNGINVSAYLAGRGDREGVIRHVMTLMQADFAASGVNLVRITGKAVAGQRATTVFVGAATIDGQGSGLRGIASSVDFGNDNATDLAFVVKTYGKANATSAELAQYTANTAAHEVGHTLGLRHVDNQGLNELMRVGAQMSDDQNAHNNLTFLDRSLYAAEANANGGISYVTSNGRYVTQNSFETVLSSVGKGALVPLLNGSGGSQVSASDEGVDLPCTCPFCHGAAEEAAAEVAAVELGVISPIDRAFSPAALLAPTSLSADLLGVVVRRDEGREEVVGGVFAAPAAVAAVGRFASTDEVGKAPEEFVHWFGGKASKAARAAAEVVLFAEEPPAI